MEGDGRGAVFSAKSVDGTDGAGRRLSILVVEAVLHVGGWSVALPQHWLARGCDFDALDEVVDFLRCQQLGLVGGEEEGSGTPGGCHCGGRCRLAVRKGNQLSVSR